MTLTIGNAYDPGKLVFDGWTTGDGTATDGYNAHDYFRDGVYLGPDPHGIEPTVRGVNLTPDFHRMFAQFLADGRNAGPRLLDGLTGLRTQDGAQALRAIQRALAPLAVAANSMTTAAEVEQFREAIADLLAYINKAAANLEA